MNDTFTQACVALIEFGYSPEADGSFVKYKADRPRERWEPTPDQSGFLRYTRDDGRWAPVPYTIAPEFEGVSGLTADKHPHSFLYVYPADYVLNVYTRAEPRGVATAVAERG